MAYGGLGCSTQPRLMRYSRWTAEFQWFFTWSGLGSRLGLGLVLGLGLGLGLG